MRETGETQIQCWEKKGTDHTGKDDSDWGVAAVKVMLVAAVCS